MNNPSEEIAVYTPEPSLKNLGKLLRSMWKDLVMSQELGLRLASRDIKAQYREAALGFVWALILPIINTVTWIFLSESGIVQVASTEIPYPIYVFTGTLLWAIFLEALNAPLSITMTSKITMAKVNFPKESLILAGVYKSLFNGIIKAVILMVALLYLGLPLSWSILLAPLGMLSLILAGTVIGVLVTPPGLLYADVGKFIPVAAQLLMFTTPVVYSIPASGWGKTLLELNPITPIIMTTRNWLTSTPAEHLQAFLWVNLALLALLFVVWAVFRISLPAITERMYA